MIRITDQYFWNFIFTIFFVILLIMGVIILETETRIPFTDLELVDYTLITLATWRVVRLFVSDEVTKWFREQFWDVKKVGRKYELIKPKNGPRLTIANLLSCPWCFGIWAAAWVTFFYLLTPYAIFPIVLLAISAVASFLQILTNMIGRRAEQLKQTAERF